MIDEVKGQAPDARGQEPQPQEEPAGQEPERFDAEYVRKLRAEAAEHRKKRRELEEILRQLEDAKLSETERLQKRLAELEKQIADYERERQERTLKYETMLVASRLGIVDPEAAYKLLDLADIDFDEDGRPKNIEKALRDLLAKRPYLAGGTSGSPTNPAKSSAVFTRSQLRDPAFFRAHKEAIFQAMREGRIIED